MALLTGATFFPRVAVGNLFAVAGRVTVNVQGHLFIKGLGRIHSGIASGDATTEPVVVWPQSDSTAADQPGGVVWFDTSTGPCDVSFIIFGTSS